MKPAARSELAQALADLELDIGTEVRRILSLATVALRAAKVEPLDAAHLLDVLEVIAAIDRFKLEHGRPFPSWSEILLIVRQLGYKRG